MATGDQQLVLFVSAGPQAGRCLALPNGPCSLLPDEAEALVVRPGADAAALLAVERSSDGRTVASPGRAAATVNDQPLVAPRPLSLGDRLGVGALSLELRARPAEVAATIAPGDAVVSSPGAGGGHEAPATSALLAAGQRVAGRYEVVRKLAQGGMGEVYEARHVELERPFALKVMRGELAGAPEFAERFKREAIAASRIGHPNIVDITDFGRTEQGSFFFVMELLDGETLGAVIEREGPQPVERLRHLARQLCGALAAAHDKGIVHRDLKPENVMLVQRPGAPDHVKLVDFGIAKVDSPFGGGSSSTSMGMLVGTPRYMSPEQASGLRLDRRSDIYSLGLIFYELLTGKPAFDAETPPQVMVQQITAPPPPLPEELQAALPSAVVETIFRMLAKGLDARPQTMDEVLVGMGETPLYRPPPSAPRAGAGAGSPRTPPPPAPPPTGAPAKRSSTFSGPTVAARPITPTRPPALSVSPSPGSAPAVEAPVQSEASERSTVARSTAGELPPPELRRSARWPVALTVALVAGIAGLALFSPRGAWSRSAEPDPAAAGSGTASQPPPTPATASPSTKPDPAVPSPPMPTPAQPGETSTVVASPRPVAAPEPPAAPPLEPGASASAQRTHAPPAARPTRGTPKPPTKATAPAPGPLKDAFADELKEDE